MAQLNLQQSTYGTHEFHLIAMCAVFCSGKMRSDRVINIILMKSESIKRQ